MPIIRIIVSLVIMSPSSLPTLLPSWLLHETSLPNQQRDKQKMERLHPRELRARNGMERFARIDRSEPHFGESS